MKRWPLHFCSSLTTLYHKKIDVKYMHKFWWKGIKVRKGTLIIELNCYILIQENETDLEGKKSGKVVNVNLLINVSPSFMSYFHIVYVFHLKAIACPFCPALLCNAKLSSLLNISRNFYENGAKEKRLTKIILLKCYILIQERRPKKEKIKFHFLFLIDPVTFICLHSHIFLFFLSKATAVMFLSYSPQSGKKWVALFRSFD